MYTKEQVIKGLQCCIIRDPDDKSRCNDCPFDGNCVNRLKMAALEFLNKSDFEVMKEILGRSRLYARDRVDNYGQDDWKIISIDGYDGVDIEFDMEGNII